MDGELDGSNETKIVLLGKTGSGKSSLGNSIVGGGLLKVKSSPESETRECQAESKVINGRHITVVDTPGFFDTKMPEDVMKREIVKCMIKCAPEIHAFLIVLEVSRYTQQEKEVINKVLEYFAVEALQHAVVVFTHGDQLEEGKTIEDFVCQSESLSDLVKKCEGRCHVVDNKYWNNNRDDDYRNNQVQLEKLLNTIETMKNERGHYTNGMLKIVEEEKKKSGEDIVERLLNMSANVPAEALLGAMLGLTLPFASTFPRILVTIGAIGVFIKGYLFGKKKNS